MVDAEHFTQAAAGQGKRQRTEAALLDAAIEVIGQKGMEAAKITDITDAAGMANGTFYNYFETKEEILLKVAMLVGVEVSRQIDVQMEAIEDGPTRVVTATQAFVELVLESPDWAAVLLDGMDLIPAGPEDAFTYLSRDISRGVSQGAFDTAPDSFTLLQIVALISSAIRIQIKNGRDETVTHRLCINILRLLGLTAHKADKVVAKLRG